MAGIIKRSTFRIYLASFGVNCATLLVHMQVGFTPRQVTRLTGVPYSTLNLWAKKGLIRPSVSEGAGSGSERIYSFSDLVALKVAFELRKTGVSTRSLEKVILFLRENEGIEQPLAAARLIVRGRDVLVVRNDRELVSALSKPGQGCLSFVVDLPRTLGGLAKVANATTTFALGFEPAKDVRGSRKPPMSAARRQQRNSSRG
jgi:DNA-binding transcriptional MerR regulator